MTEKKQSLVSLLYKQVSEFKKRPNVFIYICKKALEVKKLKKAPKDEWFTQRLNDPNYANKIVQLVVNEAISFAMQKDTVRMTGYLLPAVDNLTGSLRFGNQQTKGIIIPFLTIEGNIIGLIKWANSALLHVSADQEKKVAEQDKIPIPYFYKVILDVVVEKTEQYGKQYELKYIRALDTKQRLQPAELQQALLSNSKRMMDLKESDRFQLVIIRNIQYNSTFPLEAWRPTGKKKTRKVVVDGVESEEETNEDELERVAEGQELIQEKSGSDAEDGILIPCFRFNVFIKEKDKTSSSLTFDIWNHRFGDPQIWFGGFKSIVKEAVGAFGDNYKPESDDDAFGQISSYLRSFELIVVGKVQWLNKSRDGKGIVGGLNVSFLTDMRFPYINKNDRPIRDIISFLSPAVKDKLVIDIPTELTLKEIPKDVDIDLTGEAEELEEFEEHEDDVDDELAYQISQQGGGNIENEQFRAWLKDLTDQFIEKGYISEKDLGYDGELAYVLTETLNVYAPKDPLRFELADKDVGIEPDEEGKLFEWWKNNVQIPTKDEIEAKVDIIEETVVQESGNTTDISTNLTAPISGVTLAPTEDKPDETKFELKHLKGIFRTVTEIERENLEEHILSELKMNFDPEELDKMLQQLVEERIITYIEDTYFVSPIQPTKPKTDDDPSPMAELVGVTDRETLTKAFMKQLRSTAKEMGIKGFSKLKKDNLIDAIIKAGEELKAAISEPMQQTEKVSNETEEIPAKIEPTPVASEESKTEVISEEPESLTKEEKEQLQELEAIIYDILTDQGTITVEELYQNFGSLLPPMFGEGYMPFVAKIIKRVDEELAQAQRNSN
jgi:hypothetical protein